MQFGVPGGGFSFGPLSGVQRSFYNDPSNKGFGWQRLMDWYGMGDDNPYMKWLGQQLNPEFNRFQNTAINATAENPADWATYLEKLAPQLRERYNMLSPQARGHAPWNYYAGRYLG